MQPKSREWPDPAAVLKLPSPNHHPAMPVTSFHMRKIWSLLFLCWFMIPALRATPFHSPGKTAIDTVPVMDLGDFARKIFRKKLDSSLPVKKPGPVLLPSVGYNPSLGFVFGAKASLGKQKGNPENTGYSVYGLEVYYTSKGILTLQARHNIFTPGNKLNIQGNWQFSRFGLVDYGIGTGKAGYPTNSFYINDFPLENGDSAFPMQYNYIRLTEKIYRKIGPHLFIGGGISINIYRKISDLKLSTNETTPHQAYSLKHGFDPNNYTSNGLILALQYNTRDHPLRPYRGFYSDIEIRLNQRWMGSTKPSATLEYDLRKYFSLSTRNPEHVLAFWHLAKYKLDGEIPYLELPYTGSDTYNRMGRGYTIGRFRGPSFAYFETEYRFPIMRNKFISGNCFFNLQTASDDQNTKIFQFWEPGAGIGLRVLFQKASRTTLCMDFSKGRYGSSGIFFGLTEVF
jgi:hypothetical protein